MPFTERVVIEMPSRPHSRFTCGAVQSAITMP